MSDSSWIIVFLVGLGICLTFSFIFSSLDMAYASVNHLRLAKAATSGDKKAKRALKYAEDFDSTIATILFGNDFVNIMASSLVTLIGLRLINMGFDETWTPLVASAILVIVLLLFSEISPKALARNHAYWFARSFAPFVTAIKTLFFPFVFPINKLSIWLSSPLVEQARREDSPLASDGELEAMVDDIQKEGIIDEDTSEIIHRSIDFKDTSCYEIMTPRVKVFAYDEEDPFESLLSNENLVSHSRIPVYKGDMDHLRGYIPVKSLLRLLVKKGKVQLKDVLLPIISVPRTMPISSAMAIMKKSRHHILAVRDEFGGVEGILTMEDVLEEIVGDMYDEYDRPSSEMRRLGRKRQYIVKGSMNIFDFFEECSLDEEELGEDYSTLSGWITDRLGRFPEEGDEFRYKNIEVLVSKTKGFVVEEAYVKIHREKD